ncbi:DUF1987 domain-containing protein [Desulfohalobium retbaense]|uniref:SiaC family regulatory phosphoprotein domain-containing protein n=1 Tax=Desulfohalobium retbaense (strain ATCC 49708 / DSM 5692 / JCM 16813 / HR100) TaxID=485915 RepID=C8X5E5_DESRD|nr:DUF1987 domain-containing protein [Desulfohalobium retbaense]ACV69642.1 Domain of unknown function DUF1987 [Desulfohalobium retbaense DSM 5692]
MEAFVREKTKSTPWIELDPEQGYLRIQGESYPENAAKFYSPMLEWLQSYLDQVGSGPIQADIELIYFNSSSSKVFMNFFDMLEEAAERGAPVTVFWKYHEDNDTALECGEEFQEDLEHVDFQLQAIK